MKQTSDIASRITDRQIHSGVRLIALHAPVERVVSLNGSFLSRPFYDKGEDLIQHMVVDGLDRGTRYHNRFEIAEELDDRGAQVGFNTAKQRVAFSGQLLSEDLERILQLIAEQLREPAFDSLEMTKVRSTLTANFQREQRNTGSQAAMALSRLIYRPGHPNYTFQTEDNLNRLQQITDDDLREYHRTHFGTNDLILVVVGDIDVEALEEYVRPIFGGWKTSAPAENMLPHVTLSKPERLHVEIGDRPNLDVRMGHGIPLYRTDADYMPLSLGVKILGGMFSARLMTEIRDRMGLTYGISSSLVGMSSDYHCHWTTAVTLSGENLERGIEATLEEIRKFVEGGVTEEELDNIKGSLIGGYKVGLAGTDGLAYFLLVDAERGFGTEYIDTYPQEIAAITLDQVNSAIARYLDPDRLHIVSAGTLPV